jgi:N-acetylmuramoyl-L-alanine amidase
MKLKQKFLIGILLIFLCGSLYSAKPQKKKQYFLCFNQAGLNTKIPIEVIKFNNNVPYFGFNGLALYLQFRWDYDERLEKLYIYTPNGQATFIADFKKGVLGGALIHLKNPILINQKGILVSDDFISVVLGKLLNRKIELKNQNVKDSFLVVIDPGHGGHDEGAKCADGREEKVLVLQIALLLEKKCREYKGIKCKFTRLRDEFIELKKRTAFANKNQADLFLSLHANSNKKRDIKGFEVYFLSLSTDDKYAKQVAKFENSVLKYEGIDPEVEDVQAILLDLKENYRIKESAQVAQCIYKRFENNKFTKERGIKQAPFYVLMGAHMPAVLVEI